MTNKGKNRKKSDPTAGLNKTAHSIGKSKDRIDYHAKNSDSWSQEQIEGLINNNGKVGSIPISLIRTKDNIRRSIDPNSSEQIELQESIKKHGILQPPIVTVVEEGGIFSVVLIGGGRRIEAARSLGMTKINCLVKVFDQKVDNLTASMAENLNRKNLNPIEIADCYKSLIEQGYSITELVDMFGKDRKTISRYSKISGWSDEIRELILDNLDKLTIKKLMSIASKSLDQEAIKRELLASVSILEPSKKLSRTSKSHKLSEYFNKSDLSKEQMALVLKVMKDLKFVPSSFELS